ncbi:MAG: YggT family protein [Steroidobacteraceae bacterium]
MDALHFVVDSVLTFAVYVFLLRLLLQLARAEFRNPLAQAILALTNWLVMPLRRIVPAIGRFDTASLLALLAVQLAATLLVDRLFWSGPAHTFGALAVAALLTLIVTTIWFYIVVIAIYALLSFIAPRTYSPAVGILSSLCEPLLAPLRRILPVAGGLDFSPLVAIVLLRALLYLIP